MLGTHGTGDDGLCPVGLSTLGAVKQVEVSPVRQQAGRSWPDTWCAPVLCTVQYLYTRWAWAWKCRRWCRGSLPLASTIYCPHNKVKTWHRKHWSDGSDGSDRFGQWSDGSDRSDSVPVLHASHINTTVWCNRQEDSLTDHKPLNEWRI